MTRALVAALSCLLAGSAAAQSEPIEIVAQAGPSEAKRLQGSSRAVTVVKLDDARRRSADLGEVLARVPGVSLRRAGGLGSDFRLSLNGLYDAQVRVYLDGFPLELVRAQGLANLPIDGLSRIDVYRGVVPIRFGADALGGALDLIPRSYKASASYRVGSFGLHRVSVGGQHASEHLQLGAELFFDHARNDYPVNVEVADARGQLARHTVRRFHDAYTGYGAGASAAVLRRAWAELLRFRVFRSGYGKDLQNNVVMTVPYGEARYGEALTGALVEYEQPLGTRLRLTLGGSYAYRQIWFRDRSRYSYDWFGERVLERATPGEVNGFAVDQRFGQHAGFERANVELQLAPGHTLTANAALAFAVRRGRDRTLAQGAYDPLAGTRRLVNHVVGLEYMTRAWSMPGRVADPRAWRIENSLFVKGYFARARSELALNAEQTRRRASRQAVLGYGDSVRVSCTRWLLLKASYELTTHLPTPEQLFGNGVLIAENLELEPETSHNANFGPRVSWSARRVGKLELDLNGFLRDTDRQILLIATDRGFRYRNVYHARSLGLEGEAQWTSAGRYLTLQAAATYQDLRNLSSRGAFADYRGDRLPNRPWLFASWGAQLRFAALFRDGDELEPFYLGRYVHGFFRTWESVGQQAFKQTIDAQLSHTLGLRYGFAAAFAHVDASFEVHNLADARLYDSFGVQRPGRAYYAKLSADI